MPLVAETPFQLIAAALDAAAAEAGAIAMRWFRSGEKTTARTDFKNGGSPVTEADLAVDWFLAERLQALFPDAGWLSEETADTEARLSAESVFVIDPIDGTRGFAAGDPRWSVSIALVRGGRPVAGVVIAPALGERFVAALGHGARRNGVPLDLSSAGPLAGGRIAGPQPLAKKAETLGMTHVPKIPSLALRFAHVAGGEIEAAVSSTNSHDWDIAAADLILHEAGGMLTGLDGRAPVYNRRDLKHGPLAAASAARHAELLAAVARGH
ncbi:MAG: 3'(2'),5'-bisphosphate nucleotidase CysQ [Hyphomicrobiales bacterium]|nr:3'(2'),5'-bisphosphate nucleotidase CysQ [Hyphomicrobiales bacterium]